MCSKLSSRQQKQLQHDEQQSPNDDDGLRVNAVATIRPLNERMYVGVRYFSDWEGYGCVALRSIPRHTLIHVETAVLRGNQCTVALERHRNGHHKSKEDDVAYLREECRLTEEEIDGLWTLHDQYQGRYKNIPETRNSKRLFGIIYSNAFQDEENGHAYRMYRNAARFNHSCSPNVGYDFDGWTIRMYTTQDVQAGETLCTCYSDVVYHFGRDKRQAYLKGALNFDCACSACHPAHATDGPNNGGGDVDDSEMNVRDAILTGDEHRRRLKEIAMELRGRLGDACPLYDPLFSMSVNKFYKSQNAPAIGTGADTGTKVDIERRREQLREKARLRKLSREIPIGEYDLNLLHQYLDLLEKEGIDHDLLPVYEMAYNVAAGVNCPSKHELAEKCLNLYRLAKGADHPKTRAFNEKMKG